MCLFYMKYEPYYKLKIFTCNNKLKNKLGFNHVLFDIFTQNEST